MILRNIKSSLPKKKGGVYFNLFVIKPKYYAIVVGLDHDEYSLYPLVRIYRDA